MININADLLQWFVNSLIKRSSGVAIKRKISSNQKLVKELHKSPFKDKVMGVNFADFCKFNKEFWSLSCVIDIYRKYARLVLLKDKIGITINY